MSCVSPPPTLLSSSLLFSSPRSAALSHEPRRSEADDDDVDPLDGPPYLVRSSSAFCPDGSGRPRVAVEPSAVQFERTILVSHSGPAFSPLSPSHTHSSPAVTYSETVRGPGRTNADPSPTSRSSVHHGVPSSVSPLLQPSTTTANPPTDLGLRTPAESYSQRPDGGLRPAISSSPLLNAFSAPLEANKSHHIGTSLDIPLTGSNTIPFPSSSPATSAAHFVAERLIRRQSLPFECHTPTAPSTSNQSRPLRPSLANACPSKHVRARLNRAIFAAGSPLPPKGLNPDASKKQQIMAFLASFEKSSGAFDAIALAEDDALTWFPASAGDRDIMAEAKALGLNFEDLLVDSACAPDSIAPSLLDSPDFYNSPFSVPLSLTSSADRVHSVSTALDTSPLFGGFDSSPSIAPLTFNESMCGPSPASYADAFKANHAAVPTSAAWSTGPADAGVLTTSPETAFPELTFDPAVLLRAVNGEVEPRAAAALPRGTKRERHYDGTRNTTIPPIALDAPVQPKSYIVPSATSRKAIPAKQAKKLAEQLARARAASSAVSTPSAADSERPAKRARGRPRKTPSPEVDATAASISTMTEGQLALPPEMQREIEENRKRNRDAARQSRARKAQTLADLRDEVEQAKREKEVAETERDLLAERTAALEEEVKQLKALFGAR